MNLLFDLLAISLSKSLNNENKEISDYIVLIR